MPQLLPFHRGRVVNSSHARQSVDRVARPGTRQEDMNDRTPPPRGPQAARPLRAPEGTPPPRLRAGRGGARFRAPVAPPIGTCRALHPQTRRGSAAHWPQSPRGGQPSNGARSKKESPAIVACCLANWLPLLWISLSTRRAALAGGSRHARAALIGPTRGLKACRVPFLAS